jgi:hypothetical protein
MSAPIAVEDKGSAIGTLEAGKSHWTECSPFLVGFDGNHKGVREFGWLNDGRRRPCKCYWE